MSKDEKKYKPMTKGERQVWAATYAAEFVDCLKHPPEYACRSDAARDEWESGQIHSAVESAGCAVRYLRDNVDSIRRSYNESGPTYLMMCEMLGRTP